MQSLALISLLQFLAEVELGPQPALKSAVSADTIKLLTRNGPGFSLELQTSSCNHAYLMSALVCVPHRVSTGRVLIFHTRTPLPSSLLSKPAPPARFIPWLIILASRGVLLHSFTQEAFLEPLPRSSAGQDTQASGRCTRTRADSTLGKGNAGPGCSWKRRLCLTWLRGIGTDFWGLVTPELTHET